MNRMIAWFATNHVAANLLMGFALLAGIATLSQVPVRIIPELEVPTITITVPYLGAAPEEVESGVCIRIEEELESIVGVKEILSISNEGLCTVQLYLFYGTDMPAVLGEVETEVNSIQTFPQETEKPVVRLVTFTDIVAEVAIIGPSDERALKELAWRVRDDILQLPNITHASVANARPYEISVELSQAAMLRNQLTFDQVANAVRRQSVDLPGGSIKTDQGELLLRTRGQAYRGLELENLVVSARDDGSRVMLSDVARVVDGFADTGQSLRVDGRPAALVQVARVGEQDLREVSATVRDFISQSASRYPDGVELILWSDESVVLAERLGTLIDSGVQGLLLVLVLLALFLRPHLALWVAAGIPVALLGALFLFYLFGYSVDSPAILGFILALGMLVDDAVVVGESAYVAHRRGAGQLAGAIEGAQQVLLPVTFGVLTTAAAFLPLVLVEGNMGQLLSGTAVAVLCCLAFSLIECQMMLPAHLGHRSSRVPLGEFGLTFLVVLVIASFAFTPSLRVGLGLAVAIGALVCALHILGAVGAMGAAFARFQVKFEASLEWFIAGPFRRLIEHSLRLRHLTLAAGFAAFASAIAFLSGGHLPYTFAEASEAEQVIARVTMPLGVNEAETRRVVDQLVAAGRRARQELAARAEASGEEGVAPPIQRILASVGGHPSAGGGIGMPVPTGPHMAEVALQLTPSNERQISPTVIGDLWRELQGPMAADAEVSYVSDRLSIGNDIVMRLYSDSMDDLLAVTAALQERLSEYPGVSEITDTFEPGKQELMLSITPVGEALGLTLADLGRQVRQAFYGEEAQRIQRGRDDVRIMVRYTEEERQTLESLQSLRIYTPNGGYAPFGAVAEVEAGRGISSIQRSRGSRSIRIGARVDLRSTTANVVIGELEEEFIPPLLARYPGVSYTSPVFEEQREMAESLLPLLMLSMFAIFALLAIPLGSYLQPLIIMTALPFAFIGAIWGHMLMKVFGYVTTFSVISIFGVIAAAGVVINATLILLHGVNHRRAAGDSLHDALVDSAMSRFRPILITTVTTFAGLAPLMLSSNLQARAYSPMAISLAWGVVVGAFATLLLVPSLWLALNNSFAGARRATAQLGKLVGGAPRLTRWMARYPYVRESLRSKEFTDLQLPADLGLDPEQEKIAKQGLVRVYYEREFDAKEMRAQLGAIAERAPMADDFAAEARVWAEQRTFQLGAHMLGGVIAPSDAARPLSDILDTCLGTLLATVRREFAAEHGAPPDGRTALVALDALGRREFATGGPLRLMLLYDHGPVPASVPDMPPHVWNTQLAQRFMRLVRVLSGENTLFQALPPHSPTDAGGVCALANLREHYGERTSAADLRMLADARVIEAEGELAADFAALRGALLADKHDLAAVAADIGAARSRTERRRRAGNVWDVRHTPGGLEDMEMAAEFLQLAMAASGVDAPTRGLEATFEAAAGQRLIDSDTAGEFSAAAKLWQNLEGFFRMTLADAAVPDAAPPDQQAVIAEICGADNFNALRAVVEETAKRAAAKFEDLLAGASDRPAP